MKAHVRILAGLLLVIAFVTALGFLDGCAGAQLRAEQEAYVVTYDRELVRCKEMGKLAGSFQVFEACERAATRVLCAARPELREEWPRCAELGVSP